MTDKERLEDIKERFVKYEYDYNLNGEDVEWLIQQAERVEELEEENENVKHQSFQQELDIAVLESENKRYKKALERIVYEDISGWSSQDILGKVIDIAHEALEGESE